MKTKILILTSLFASSSLFAVLSGAPQNDFTMPNTGWKEIRSKDHTGEQRLLTIKDTFKDQIYLYWMGPGAESTIQEHPKYEEVIIAQGSLYWLNKDKSILKELEVGSYVDRKPHINHGPFRAGPNGCLMYVRFHS